MRTPYLGYPDAELASLAAYLEAGIRLRIHALGNPVVALNCAIAMAMVHGPRVGLDLLTGLAKDTRIATGHRLHAVRAQLLEMAGQPGAARAAYLEAARHTTSLPHQRYLHAQAARLTEDA